MARHHGYSSLEHDGVPIGGCCLFLQVCQQHGDIAPVGSILSREKTRVCHRKDHNLTRNRRPLLRYGGRKSIVGILSGV